MKRQRLPCKRCWQRVWQVHNKSPLQWKRISVLMRLLFGLCRGDRDEIHCFKCALSSCFGVLLRSRVPTPYACVDVFLSMCIAIYPDIFHGGVRDRELQPMASPRVVSPASLIQCFVYIILQSNLDPNWLSLFFKSKRNITWPIPGDLYR